MFEHLVKGDKVIRMLAGTIPMPMTVFVVEGDIIKCTADGAGIKATWWFDAKTGAEIDDEIGWGPKYGVTGSFLKPEGPKPAPQCSPEPCPTSSDSVKGTDPIAGPA